MKKITINARNAFNENRNFKSNNTEVLVSNDLNGIQTTYLYLFGNLIAFKDNTGTFIDSCGWKSNTTKERLNALNGVQISQKNYQWYLNGEKWNGQLTKV